MSDDDINHASRVGSADHVDKAEHVDTVNTLSISTIPREPTKDQRTLVLLKWLLAVLAAVAVLASVLTAGYVLVSRNTALDSIHTQLADVTSQLADAKTQLAATQKQLADQKNASTFVSDCSGALSRNITATSQQAALALSNFAIAGFSGLHPDPKPVQDANDVASKAVVLRDSWVAARYPQPCPVDVQSAPTG